MNTQRKECMGKVRQCGICGKSSARIINCDGTNECYPCAIDKTNKMAAYKWAAANNCAIVPLDADDELVAKFQTHGGLTQILTPLGLRAAYEFFIRKAQEQDDE